MIELNKTYNYHGELLKCIKIRQSGINSFQVIDFNGTDIILRNPKEPGSIVDFGRRLIKCFKCSKCGMLFFPDKIFSYVDGNNGSITKNSKGYCIECYKIIYK